MADRLDEIRARWTVGQDDVGDFAWLLAEVQVLRSREAGYLALLEQRARAEREVRAEVERLRAELATSRAASSPPPTVDETVDLLWLADVTADRAVVASWTDAEREQAADWAGAVHLRASDHDDVEVPPVPPHVAALGEASDAE